MFARNYPELTPGRLSRPRRRWTGAGNRRTLVPADCIRADSPGGIQMSVIRTFLAFPLLVLMLLPVPAMGQQIFRLESRESNLWNFSCTARR